MLHPCHRNAFSFERSNVQITKVKSFRLLRPCHRNAFSFERSNVQFTNEYINENRSTRRFHFLTFKRSNHNFQTMDIHLKTRSCFHFLTVVLLWIHTKYQRVRQLKSQFLQLTKRLQTTSFYFKTVRRLKSQQGCKDSIMTSTICFRFRTFKRLKSQSSYNLRKSMPTSCFHFKTFEPFN